MWGIGSWTPADTRIFVYSISAVSHTWVRNSCMYMESWPSFVWEFRIQWILYFQSVFGWKNLCISRPRQFKAVLFKGQLYSIFSSPKSPCAVVSQDLCICCSLHFLVAYLNANQFFVLTNCYCLLRFSLTWSKLYWGVVVISCSNNILFFVTIVFILYFSLVFESSPLYWRLPSGRDCVYFKK